MRRLWGKIGVALLFIWFSSTLGNHIQAKFDVLQATRRTAPGSVYFVTRNGDDANPGAVGNWAYVSG